jgi:8-oxo-dGTP pyrophosphatase MutT (NUDIX family)
VKALDFYERHVTAGDDPDFRHVTFQDPTFGRAGPVDQGNRVAGVARQTVKLLLVDRDDRLLLIRGRDGATGLTHWYPVGGGIEGDESHHEAAVREAWEETGVELRVGGEPVWTREAQYSFSGSTWDVHETWLRYRVEHFDPAPARLSEHEAESIVGFRWWTADELAASAESVFPAHLGPLYAGLLTDGPPVEPVDITVPGQVH